jgi:uncharacterized membrane protein
MWLPVFYSTLCKMLAVPVGAAAVYVLTPRGWKRIQSWISAEQPPRIIRWVGGILLVFFAGWMLVLKTCQYLVLQSMHHVSMYLSMIWQTGAAGFLPNSFLHLRTQLGDHFEPVTVLYTPLARLAGSPLLVICVHGLLILSSIFIVWHLCRRVGLSRGWGYLISAWFLTNPFFQGCLSTAFYPTPLAIPLFLMVLLSWEKDRWRAMVLWSMGLLLTKEEAGIALAALGIASCCLPHKRKLGLILLATGLGGWLVSLSIMGHFQQDLPSKWRYFTGGASGDPPPTALGVISHPLQLIERWAWPPQRFTPFLSLLYSTGGLILFFPPAFLAVLLTNAPHQIAFPDYNLYWLLVFNYSSYLVPLLCWGTVHGLARAWTWKKRLRPYLVAIVLATTSIGCYRMAVHVAFIHLSPQKLQAAWSALLSIGPNESVWTSSAFAPALSFRPKIALYNEEYEADAFSFIPDVILVDVQDLLRDGPETQARLNQYLEANNFRLQSQNRGVLLFRRLL